MTRKSFFKSLLTVSGIGAVLGLTGMIKNVPIKLNKNDEIKQLNGNFFVVRIKLPNDNVYRRVNEYLTIFKQNGWKGIIIPDTDKFDSLNDYYKMLPPKYKQEMLKAIS